MSSPDECSFNVSDTDQEHQALSSLLLPGHSSTIKSQSSTCLPMVGTTSTTNQSSLWTKVSEFARGREGSSTSRNTELSAADVVPLRPRNEAADNQHVRESVRRPRGAERAGSTKRPRPKIPLDVVEPEKEEPLSPFGRKVIIFVGVSLVFLCMLLVGVTLRLGPIIDEMVRKENEEIYRAMSSGPSTAAPVADGSTVGTANVTGTDHTG